MKRYTSRFLKSVAIAYMAFPALYLLLAALLFDIPAHQCFRILISPLFYIVSFWAVLAGYGLWEMRRWAWYIFLIATLFIAYGSAIFVADYGETNHKALALSFSVALLIVLVVRLAKEVRVPYFHPHIPWWEPNPRYRLTVPAKVTRKDGEVIEGQILDVSLGGCFVKLRSELTQDEHLSIAFTIFGQDLQCPGIVVWRTQSTVTHPKGIGIKFTMMPRSQRRTLRAVNARLKKIWALYRSSRYLMSQDEFSRRMEELNTQKLTPKS